MKPFVQVLIQSAWCPCKKREFGCTGPRDEWAERRRHVRTRRGRPLQAQERGLRGDQPCQALDLRLLTSRTMGKMNVCCLNHRSTVFCLGSLSGLRQSLSCNSLSTKHCHLDLCIMYSIWFIPISSCQPQFPSIMPRVSVLCRKHPSFVSFQHSSPSSL